MFRERRAAGSRRLGLPSPAMLVALLALFLAMGGSTYAAITLPAHSVGTKQLKNGAVTGKKVKTGSLLASNFKSGQLPQGAKGDTGATGPQGASGPTGPAGADGHSVLSGAGAPAAGLGVVGDFYINTTNTTIYGPKTAAGWGNPTSLVGSPSGAAGGDLTGTYPNPTIAAGAVTGLKIADGTITEQNLDTQYNGIVSSTTEVPLRLQHLLQLNGVTSVRVVLGFSGGTGTAHVYVSATSSACSGTAVATYSIPSGVSAPATYISPSITVGAGDYLTVCARATFTGDPVIVRDVDLQWGS
jgi:hypothetical protein